jgi:hypothetical protein
MAARGGSPGPVPLVLRVLKGTGLPSVELTGRFQDPFVQLALHAGDTLLSQQKTASTRMGGRDAVWRDAGSASVTFDAPDGGPQPLVVHVEVAEDGAAGPTFLGRGQVGSQGVGPRGFLSPRRPASLHAACL